jgi:hypothetical protein
VREAAEVTDPPPDTVAALYVTAVLSVANTGRMLDCSPRTVRRRIAEGVLPAVIENGRTMVRADELRAYIDSLERVGGRPVPTRQRAPSPGRFDFLREP